MDHHVSGRVTRSGRRASRPLGEIPSSALNSQRRLREVTKPPARQTAHSATQQSRVVSEAAIDRSDTQHDETSSEFPDWFYGTRSVRRNIWPPRGQGSSSPSSRHPHIPASTSLSTSTAPRSSEEQSAISFHGSPQRNPTSARSSTSQPTVTAPSSNATFSSIPPNTRTLTPPAAWQRPTTGLDPFLNDQVVDLTRPTGPAERATASVTSSSLGPSSRQHPSLPFETVSSLSLTPSGSSPKFPPASSSTHRLSPYSRVPFSSNTSRTSSAFPAEYSHLRREAQSLLQLADPTMPPLIPAILGDLDSSPEPPGDASEEIQKLFQNLPDIEIAPEDRANTPPQMSCKLMEHQKVALKWLKDQEKNRDKKGGLLAGMSLRCSLRCRLTNTKRIFSKFQYFC